MNIGHYKAALAGAIASQFALIAFLSLDPGSEDAVQPGMRTVGTTPAVTEPVPAAPVVNEETILVSREELIYLIEVAVNRAHTRSDGGTASERTRTNNATYEFGDRTLVAQEVKEDINQVAIEGEISPDRLSDMLVKMEQLNEDDRNALTTELIRNINQQKINFETTY